MMTSKQYAKMLKDAHKYGLNPYYVACLKDCVEMALVIETAAKQPFEADSMTVIQEAIKTMKEAD